MHLSEKELRALVPKIELVSPLAIQLNPDNPRTISEKKFKALVKSIIDFYKMLYLRPIILNDQDMALGGNMRTLAARKAGFELVPVIRAKNLTELEQREFILKDNVPTGDWDMDKLANEWSQDLLADWGFSAAQTFQAPDTFRPGIDDGDDIGGSSGKATRQTAPAAASFNLLVRCNDGDERERIQQILEDNGLTLGDQFYHV